MLLAARVPPYGDTEFASQYAAYEARPRPGRLLDDLKAVNASSKADATRTREDSPGKRKSLPIRSGAPVVVRTRKRAASAVRQRRAHGALQRMTEEESAPLLAFFSATSQARVHLRFHGARARWRSGITLRAAQPVNDYHGHRRVMHRIPCRRQTSLKQGQTRFFARRKMWSVPDFTETRRINGKHSTSSASAPGRRRSPLEKCEQPSVRLDHRADEVLLQHAPSTMPRIAARMESRFLPSRSDHPKTSISVTPKMELLMATSRPRRTAGSPASAPSAARAAAVLRP